MLEKKNISWKFKKEIPPQGSSNEFWYDLTDGGYIKPEQILEDQKQLKIVNDAIKVLWSFQEALGEAKILHEF